MANKLVAIVGRPNVGKSTFFNKVVGRKISIVENFPGVTRDRLYADAEWNGKFFTLVDTGGLELKSTDKMWKHIQKQAEIAIETADVIILFTDAKSGLSSADEDVANKLRKSGKPVLLAVNKLDNYDPNKLYEFYNLGLGEPYGISSEHGTGIGDLLDAVVSLIGDEGNNYSDEYIKLAIVGKPNAGKSSLCNKILGYNRTIVSDIAGTTRDAIDTPFTYKDKKYMIIDTAGIRKKKKVEEDLEYYSVLRALGAIRRADVCVIMIDVNEGLTEQDIKICGYVHEQGKPSVIVMNKWDTIEKDTNTINKFTEKMKEDLKFMDYFQPIFVSCLTGQRTDKILDIADRVLENSRRRITTGQLNDLVLDCVRASEPPSFNGKRLKIKFVTQNGVNPPTFVFFVNEQNLMHFSYKRYLENCLRKAFDFSGTPIKLVIRERDDDD
ncbi:MAG: ribosome biogenesis GTPase Der [Clostridia bacterium]|nr:ribosome biogenesis GTPase Der [Clostridia bacterium]